MRLAHILGALVLWGAFASNSLAEELYKLSYTTEIGNVQIETITLSETNKCLAFLIDESSEGTIFDVCSRQKIWGEKLKTSTWDQRSVVFTPDGSGFALANLDRIRIINLANGQIVQEFRGPSNAAFVAAAFSNGGTFFAARDFKNEKTVIYDVESGSVTQEIDAEASAASNKVKFSDDGRKLYIAGINSLSAYDIASGKTLAKYESDSWIFSVRFSPREEYAAFAIGKNNARGMLRIIDLETMETVREFTGLGNIFGGSLRFSLDYSKVAWMSMKGQMSIWNIASGEQIYSADNEEFTDPNGYFMMWRSRPLMRFTYDMSADLDFFVTTHPNSTLLEIWEIPSANLL